MITFSSSDKELKEARLEADGVAWCVPSQGSGTVFRFWVLAVVALTLGLRQMVFRHIADEAERGVFCDFSVGRTQYYSSYLDSELQPAGEQCPFYF